MELKNEKLILHYAIMVDRCRESCKKSWKILVPYSASFISCSVSYIVILYLCITHLSMPAFIRDAIITLNVFAPFIILPIVDIIKSAERTYSTNRQNYILYNRYLLKMLMENIEFKIKFDPPAEIVKGNFIWSIYYIEMNDNSTTTFASGSNTTAFRAVTNLLVVYDKLRQYK